MTRCNLCNRTCLSSSGLISSITIKIHCSIESSYPYLECDKTSKSSRCLKSNKKIDQAADPQPAFVLHCLSFPNFSLLIIDLLLCSFSYFSFFVCYSYPFILICFVQFLFSQTPPFMFCTFSSLLQLFFPFLADLCILFFILLFLR